MEERALYRVHVFVQLVLQVKTAVQTSTFVHLELVLMVGHASRDMGQKLAVFVLKDLLAQVVTLIFHSVKWTHALMGTQFY